MGTPPPKGNDLVSEGEPLLPTPAAEPHPTPTMPRHDHDNSILTQVASSYGVTGEKLAQATGISATYISRIFSGQYAAPPPVLRALWDITRDHRVARVALGEHCLEQIRSEPTDPRHNLVYQASAAMSAVSDGIAAFYSGQSATADLQATITEAGRALRELHANLDTPEPLKGVNA